jgi:chemotaxis protein methyltransferase CheR
MRRDADGRMEVLPEVRREVHLRKFNLMMPVFPFKKPFQVIFCRNVMIYFDVATRAGLVNRLTGCLTPGGLLFVGPSEAIHGEPGLEYVRPAVYRRKGKLDRP